MGYLSVLLTPPPKQEGNGNWMEGGLKQKKSQDLATSEKTCTFANNNIKKQKHTTMRITQTFWSGTGNPLNKPYGWNHAEHNLMSWALSCCSLREHYDDVILYTDRQGYEVLIEKLRLPYTEVHVMYDDNLCLPQHWAYAKVKTYSLQTEPFLHVDGDIYAPKPFPQEAANAPLVAQNREIGTVYYRRMMDNILRHEEITLPRYITDALGEESIASYNMGIFGGSDLEFIHRYCGESFAFLENNRMNDRSLPYARVGCNILFEQVFFAVLADMEGKEVASVLGRAMKDEGYSGREFCDLAYWNQRPFFHLLGGHKRNPYNEEMIRRTLLRLYPDVLERVLALFPERHRRFSGKTEEEPACMSVERSIACYEDAVERQQKIWDSLRREELYAWEKRTAESAILMRTDGNIRQDLWMECCPIIESYHFPDGFHPEALRLMHGRLGIEEQFPLTDVLMLPCLYDKGMREVPVVETQMKALRMLQEHPMKYGELEAALLSGFTLTSEESVDTWRKIMERQIGELVHRGAFVLNPGNGKDILTFKN